MAIPTPRAIALAWFRREDYARIREISDDDLPATFEEWQKLVEARLKQPPTAGLALEKFIVDPEELLTFARSFHSGKINSQVRAQFASLLAAKKYSSTH